MPFINTVLFNPHDAPLRRYHSSHLQRKDLARELCGLPKFVCTVFETIIAPSLTLWKTLDKLHNLTLLSLGFQSCAMGLTVPYSRGPQPQATDWYQYWYQTGTSTVRTWAAQQEVSGGQVSESVPGGTKAGDRCAKG